VLDFRYHALSIVAVFLALGIGIVLGATLGDSVVSQANKDVRSSLQGDLLNALARARKASDEVALRDRFGNSVFPYLAGGKLHGQRIAIVSSGPLPQEIENPERNAVKDAGGTIDSVSQLDARPDVVGLAKSLGGRFKALASDPTQLRQLGRRIGHALADGGKLPRKLETSFPDAFKGDYHGADAILYYRSNDERDTNSKTFESALIEGLRARGVPVVGAERSDTEPSQIPYYVTAGLSTVDNVEIPPGRIALVMTLMGRTGDFGFKKTAQAPLPPGP
jgi:hypothetical protein